MMRTLMACLLASGGILFSVRAQTNTYHSNEIWTRLALIKEIASKWEVRTDINYRWQSNFLQRESNPFVFPQSHLFRITGTYRTKNNFAFNVSPFLYADNFRLRYADSLKTEVQAVKQREIRFTAGVQKILKIRDLQIRPRLMYEYRHFLESDPQWRARFQVHLQYPLYKPSTTHTLSALAFNEIFYNTTHWDKIALDQNRSFLGIFYQTGKLFEYQLGYQFTHQKQTTLTLQRSQLLTYIHIRF
jgi:hypothetical protein